MAYTNLSDLFKGICDAIRVKKGTTGNINHQDIPSEIAGIEVGITPVGEKKITTNGTYDITSYSSANVNVPIPSGYVYPTYTYETVNIVTISPGESHIIQPRTYIQDGYVVTTPHVTPEKIHNSRYDSIIPTSKRIIQIPYSEIETSVYSDEEIKLVVMFVAGDYLTDISSSTISAGVYNVADGAFTILRAGSGSRSLYYVDEDEITYTNDTNGMTLTLASNVRYFFDPDVEYEVFLITQGQKASDGDILM